MAKAIYAFSGDPITFGHIDIIKRTTRAFDEVIVGIGVNPDKKYMFTLDQRTDMAKQSLHMIPNVRVVSFKGLLVDYAFEHEIPVIIKGVRNIRDFDYEVMLHQLSESQKLDIDTYMLPAKQDLAHISSSAAKALQLEQGLIHDYVPLYVKMCLEAKISGQYIIGITGEIGTGKSYVSKEIEEIGHSMGIPVHHIELDHIGHQITGILQEPIYKEVRNKIAEKFGQGVQLQDGSINRKILGEIVFNDADKLKELNNILYTPLMVRLRRQLYMKKGLILFNAALIAESNMAYLCNNNIVLVTADKKSQKRRLTERSLTQAQINKRLESQFNTVQKKESLLSQINNTSCGQLWIIDNSDNSKEDNLKELFTLIVNSIDKYGELRFLALWKRLEAGGSYESEYNTIVQHYSEYHRSYHTMEHILNGLEELNNINHLLSYPDELECAWWYHDIIYKPGSLINEEESASYTRGRLSATALSKNKIHRICDFILKTKHPAAPTSTDDGYLIDIDLAILGKSYTCFLAYEEKIRNEYYFVQDHEYVKERKKFLSLLLEQSTLYHTDYFRKKYEKQARENITQLITNLGK
ncbi:MAG: pantetheine-phosphate adenylyltransferase [Spirochaetales bacterium]|nr:pantetheine-phosphate adenylyltransferase [Spirochaetales bacterium]